MNIIHFHECFHFTKQWQKTMALVTMKQKEKKINNFNYSICDVLLWLMFQFCFCSNYDSILFCCIKRYARVQWPDEVTDALKHFEFDIIESQTIYLFSGNFYPNITISHLVLFIPDKCFLKWSSVYPVWIQRLNIFYY